MVLALPFCSGSRSRLRKGMGVDAFHGFIFFFLPAETAKHRLWIGFLTQGTKRQHAVDHREWQGSDRLFQQPTGKGSASSYALEN